MKWIKYLDKRPSYNKSLVVILNNGNQYLARFLENTEVGAFIIDSLSYDDYNYDMAKIGKTVKYWIELPGLPEEKGCDHT